MIHKIIIVVLASLFSTQQALAQIEGRVVDEKASPVAFANVVLMDADSAFIAGSTTDASGAFRMRNDNPNAALLKISAVGYRPVVNPLAQNGNMGTMVLPLDDVTLDEVTITKQRPVHKLSKGGVITNVNGTTLELLGNAMDVIEQMPAVRREDDKITVFGKGTPTIYLNGRKLTDNSELLLLSSKEIESVEVINNPDSKYGADVKSVLIVRSVKKHGDGWSGSVQAVARAAHSWSQSDIVSLNYRKNGLDLFGSFAFDYASRYQKQKTE